MNGNKARLEFTHEETVARIMLAAPKANILDRAMICELILALEECSDRELNAIVFAADGSHFSFGASLQEHLPDQIEYTLRALHSLLEKVSQAGAPVIAAVRGQCLGGGLELVLACDLIIADRTAQFASPEIKVGVFAPAASALLPVRIGQALSSRLLLTGGTLTAEDAARFGLIAKVVDDLDLGLDEWLRGEFVSRSPAALRFASRAARLGIRRALEEDLPALERVYLSELMAVPSANEGICAFLEKRQPQWRRPVPAKYGNESRSGD